MNAQFTGYSFTTGVVRNRDTAYLLATRDDLVADDVPHTRVYLRHRGRWRSTDLEWIARSATMCHVPQERFVAISDLGFVLVLGGGQLSVEQSIGKGPRGEPPLGLLVQVRGIARGRAYAVGTGRTAYRREAQNDWTRIDQTAQTGSRDITDTCFHSIDGFTESDIYAVGWEGEIWHFDGRTWSEVPSPTNLALYEVRCGGDEFVYACGQHGILLRGRGERWEVIDQEETEEDFWGLEWFNSRLYVATLHFVYELDGSDIRIVQMGTVEPPATCYHLSSADGVLWSIGAKDVMEYDGTTWSRVI